MRFTGSVAPVTMDGVQGGSENKRGTRGLQCWIFISLGGETESKDSECLSCGTVCFAFCANTFVVVGVEFPEWISVLFLHAFCFIQ